LILPVDSFFDRRTSIPIGTADNGFRELLCGDRRRFEPDAEELSDETNAVVTMADGNLGLKDLSELSRFDDG